MSPARGYGLPEALLALALGGIAGTGLMAAVAGSARVARLHAEHVAEAELLRVARTAIAAELRFLDPAADLRAVAADSLPLRALRGIGVVCAREGDALLVRYRGLRDPEPAKDSVLVVGMGPIPPAQLEHSEAVQEGCPTRPGETIRRWIAGDPPPAGALLLLFESGSYHLAGGALRYRRGAGGRQPITEERLDDDASGFRALDPPAGWTGRGSPAVELSLATMAAGRSARVAGRVRLAFLNRAEAGADSTAGGRP